MLLIYFVGKPFYKLAIKYERSKWLYAFFGVALYYCGIFLFGFTLGILMEFGFLEFMIGLNEIVFELICLPFGILVSWGFYNYLNKLWVYESWASENSDLLDK
jgi:hypothetical protein|tara:strand:- start:3487 stop:3795 length:309 start_codon:yes stop_codon:yes gene_type:complete